MRRRLFDRPEDPFGPESCESIVAVPAYGAQDRLCLLPEKRPTPDLPAGEVASEWTSRHPDIPELRMLIPDDGVTRHRLLVT